MEVSLKACLIVLLPCLPAFFGCASTHTYERVEPPRITFKDEPTTIGLIDVTAKDADLGQVVYRALQDAVGPRLEVKTSDLRSVGHGVDWNVPDFFDDLKSQLTFTPKKKPTPFLTLPSTAQIAPPLLVSVNAPHWVSGQGILMAVTTWTRKGKEIHTSWVTAGIGAPPYGRLSLQVDDATVIDGGRMVFSEYERADEGTDARSLPPSEATQRSLFFLKHALGAVLYPYLSHTRMEQIVFVEQPASLATGIQLTKQARYAEAYDAFMKVAEAEPTNHGALNNAAQVKWAMGDDRAAAELMKRANAISSTPLSRGFQEKYEKSLAGHQVIDAGSAPAAP